MDMTGEERIAAKRAIVWQALNSPNILRKCIPNCETLDKKSPTEMDAAIKVKVGPVSATMKATVNLTKLNPPHSYTIVVDGSAGLVGSAKGTCDVRLTEDGNETVLSYTVNAKMGGSLALMPSKAVESSSKKIAESFFRKFSKIAAKRAAKVELKKAQKNKTSDVEDGDDD
jgi:carbon monoxide dehydrogenase subunit G